MSDTDFKPTALTSRDGKITRLIEEPREYHDLVWKGWTEASESDAKAAADPSAAGVAVDGKGPTRDRKAAAEKAAATRKANRERAEREQSGTVDGEAAVVENHTTAA